MRRDIFVPNETDGFVFTSASLRAKGMAPGSDEWGAAARAGDLLPLSVESEDPATVRVVVDEPLNGPETEEWVGSVRTFLRVPDGRLAMCGGVAYVSEPGTWAEDDARVLQIPAGGYRATLYCYASAPNGRRCVEASGSDEPLGSWFRRTRPGQPTPVWLHNLCVNDPSLDPGHKAQWKRETERPGGAVVDFLLHLERADGELTVAPLAPEGFMEAGECRTPDVFPLGIPTSDSASAEQPAEPRSPAKKAAKESSPRGAAALSPIDGPPVTVAIGKLARVARVAWMCHPYTHPNLRITMTGDAPRVDWDTIEDVTVKRAGNELHIEFANNGQPADALMPLTAVAKHLAGLPDNTIIELESARPKAKGPLGAHRYRGKVRDGVWHIDAAAPPVSAASLAEAVALAEALESGRRLVARDEDEAIQIQKRADTVLADYFGSNALERAGAELVLRRRDNALFLHVVARVFWSRYAAVWPLQDEDQMQQ